MTQYKYITHNYLNIVHTQVCIIISEKVQKKRLSASNNHTTISMSKIIDISEPETILNQDEIQKLVIND